MQDHFIEEVATKKSKVMSEICYVIANIMWVVMGIAAVFMLNMLMYAFDVMSLIFTLLMAGGAVGIFFLRNHFNTEYEYTFTNGALDFAVIYNNKKRKSLGSLNVANIEAFGPVNSDRFQRYCTMRDVKNSNWFVNRGAELYYFYFTKGSDKKMIVFEPSQELVDAIRLYIPRGSWQAA